MYEDQAAQVDDFEHRLAELVQCLDVKGKQNQIAELEKQMEDPHFWDDPETAQKIVQKRKMVNDIVAGPEKIRSELEDLKALLELAQEEEDATLGGELDAQLETLQLKLTQLEITSLFSDPRDELNALVSIHPGAGGTESCDWAEMLYRMIVRACERHEFETELLEYQAGDEAGVKSATLKVSGPYAFGTLRSEDGVHRLVRISPYDASKRRHTSFAAIEVLTELKGDIEIEVSEEDLKMDVYRASGPGGQKVNKTSSAVRLTHIPTGIVVACQVERSQHRNRQTAIDMLKARLYDIEMKKQEAEQAAHREGQQDVAWGSQIRSYVLHPYQMVKDHRTNQETGNVDRVLDGDLDIFVEGFLKWKLGRKSAASAN